MVNKTWDFFYKFHHLTCLVLVSLLAAALYFTCDINYSKFVKNQQKLHNDDKYYSSTSTSSSSGRCDFFSGTWIYDNKSTTYPLYKERECSFMDDTFACEKHGRKDFKYQRWRWQPHNCDIPMFNGTILLEKLRGKKLIFVGDSLNRNQWVSLLCLIEPFLPPSSNKKLILDGNMYFFHDTEYNTTIGFYWSPFLVESNADNIWDHRVPGRVIGVESIENHARHWNDADILIFDSYAWWLHPLMTLMWGSFGSSEAIYKTVDMKLRRYEMALTTWSDWLELNINRTRTKLFFMSVSPYLYRGDVLRNCLNRSEPLFMDEYLVSTKKSMRGIVESTIEKLEERGVKVEYLHITRMSEYRTDAHPSIYSRFSDSLTEEEKKHPRNNSDCLHWCLPGVPDVWNQILSDYIIN
ncbi:hypothetical protein ACP275_10G011300 [Erythranthe tilingii]